MINHREMEVEQYIDDIEEEEYRDFESREDFINKNQSMWYQIGQELKKQREELGITKTKMAQLIGCSRSKLTSFEEGKPIMSANMMERSYQMALELYELEQYEYDDIDEEDLEENIEESEDRTLEHFHAFNMAELENFWDIILNWITHEDRWYDLYRFLRENMDEEEEYAIFVNDKFAKKFLQMLLNITELDEIKEIWEKSYIEEKEEYEKFKANGNISDHDVALINLFSDVVTEYGNRDDEDATLVLWLVKIIAKQNGLSSKLDSLLVKKNNDDRVLSPIH